jgi:hypothetical protein
MVVRLWAGARSNANAFLSHHRLGGESGFLCSVVQRKHGKLAPSESGRIQTRTSAVTVSGSTSGIVSSKLLRG